MAFRKTQRTTRCIHQLATERNAEVVLSVGSEVSVLKYARGNVDISLRFASKREAKENIDVQIVLGELTFLEAGGLGQIVNSLQEITTDEAEELASKENKRRRLAVACLVIASVVLLPMCLALAMQSS